MKRYALIGKQLGHSWSQRWFEAMFQRLGLKDHCYSLCEISTLDNLRQWVEKEHIDGFNVTIPFKQSIIPMLDALSPEAEAIGAVNCVCVADGRLVGHNTDAPAFKQTIDELATPRTALILGTGGAARAVGYALWQKGIEHLYVSREKRDSKLGIIGYDKTQVQDLQFNMIINATPVGMWPNVDASPWPWPELFGEGITVYDLIYNPSPTLLMRQASERGAIAIDGLAMLHRQAELSWKLWRQL